MTGAAHRGRAPGERRVWPVEPLPIWPKPVEVLRRMVASRTTSTVSRLRRQVRRFDENYDEQVDWFSWSEKKSDLMVMWLTVRCGCGRHRQGCPGDGCTCRVRGHRLDEWDPQELPLGVFLANAVQGLAAATAPSALTSRATIKGDAFARSMLRAVLDGSGYEPIQVGDVLARRCSCRRRFELPDGPDVCPGCGRPDRPGANARELMRHVILLPAAGGYERRRFVECRACQNFFEFDDLLAGHGCPLASCRHRAQLRCPAHACPRYRAADSIGEPCGCGHRITVRCSTAACHERYTPADLHELVEQTGVLECPCGGDLVGALHRAVRRLVVVRTLWVRRRL